MIIKNYIAVTLVGGHKLYSMPKFFEYMNKLNKYPDVLFISTTEQIYNECIQNKIINFPVKHIQGKNDKGNDQIESTTSAREEIRLQSLLYMQDNPEIEWVLWLDNDIGVPSNLIEKANELLQPEIVMLNSHHPARQDSVELRHGMACTFTHRDALAGFSFVMASIRGMNYGDDQIWLYVVHALARRDHAKAKSISGVLFDVIHFVEDGREKVLPEHLRSQI